MFKYHILVQNCKVRINFRFCETQVTVHCREVKVHKKEPNINI